MSVPVQRQPAVMLSPSHPTPLSPPLPLSPLDIAMLSSRLDFIYLFDKRSDTAAQLAPGQPAPARATAASPSRSSPAPYSASPSSPGFSSPRHYHIPPADASFLGSSHLQLALRDTLSDYHVLAGRLTVNSYGQQCIRLTDDGVAWINAAAAPSLTVDSLLPAAAQRGDWWAHTRDEDALIAPLPAQPNAGTPLLQIQYTALGCGGVALGVSVYAGVMDAKALFVFINCWAQASRGRPHTRPSHERHTLATMRVSADVNHTHSEYLIVAKDNRRPTSAPTAAAPPSPAPNASVSSAGTTAVDMTQPHTTANGRRNELHMCTFHFTKHEIERMKRTTATHALYTYQSASASASAFASATSSPVLSPSYVSSPSLPPLMLRGGSNPLSPPGSTPASPLGSAMAEGAGMAGGSGGGGMGVLSVHHPGYVSSFDCLAAHVWQCVMRARFPQLVNALPQPPPPPAPTIMAVVSPTRSLPSTPTHRRSAGSTSLLDRSSLLSSASFPSPSSPAPLLSPSSPPPSAYNPFTSPPLSFPSHLAIAFNGRNRLSPPLPDVYCGNVTFLTLVTMPLPELLTAPLTALCSAVHARMLAMQDDYLRSALTVLSNPPPPAYKLIPSFDTRASTADVLLSSFLSCDVYRTADFGAGRPAYVGIGGGGERGRWEGCAVLMGGGGGGADGGGGGGVVRDGVDVSVVLREDEMRRLCSDERLRCWRVPDGMGGLMEGMEHLELTAAAAQERVTSDKVTVSNRFLDGLTVAR